ncbi:uncharacterized protein LY89DRAFT_724851 [Mollisia scopiformis]|uniref:Uncharacterized protein n=1 Tax=Mollisia scopiformis TaxID=149040 RepID=A0A132B9D1_MOLSC|nr:uncharacterized protein LY89DRAFT_724851 [Mollisia scopiformis]KUJ08863.1 hypothetical protein LY89DRAFT_724851 [Mollisia scopiformis]
MAGKAHQSLNVMKKPLGLFSKDPMTGFYRTGFCDVGPEDAGNHSVAATLTDPFLDFTASRGNDLRGVGLTAGCKWCLCASRWKEAMLFAKEKGEGGGKEGEGKGDVGKGDVVPKVHLHATHERALDVVGMEDLKKYAAEPEVGNASNVAQSRKGGMGGAVKERTELAGKEGMTSRE